ncbi:invasion associated locus B family protein [Salinisphaera sp. SPP-AMP-43]|uniref:invasion associated locus B family protein n=1 Tax=Salinisphaera sp. SPP-AMP-43 TaxID=3121288 RepID=UPI003C6E9C4C
MFRAFRFSAVLLCAAALLGLTGTAAAQDNAPGQQSQDDVKITHYEDWEVRCPKSGNQSECEMTQLVKSPDTGKPIMRVVMGYPPQINTPAMIVILPLGTRLAPGVQLSVDGDQARRFPFQICLQQGCRADFPIKNQLLSKLKGGRTAAITIVGPKGDQINLKVSLSGFTDANNAIAK